MHGLLAPVLAQLIALALSDRVEAHYVVNDRTKYFEGSNTTTPGALARFDWRRASLTLSYTPTLTVVPLFSTAPDSLDRALLVYHRAFATAAYRWRRTTLTVASNIGYGERDFYREALVGGGAIPVAPAAAQTQAQPNQSGQNQPPSNTTTPPAGSDTTSTGGTKGTGTTPVAPAQNPPAASSEPVPYGEFRAGGNIDHVLSRIVAFRLGGGYSISGGIDRESQRRYPLVRGPDAIATLQIKVDARNAFATTVNFQLAYSEDGTDSGYLNATENYTHLFSRQTTFTASAGLSLSENTPPGGLTLYGVYPTGGLSITHSERVARGRLVLMAMVNSMPVLDLYTGSIDPRLGTYATVGWSRDRFAITATVNSSVSVAQNNVNAFNAFYANLTMRYKIGGGFSWDSGINTAWEKYANQTNSLIPASAVFIMGLSWGGIQPIVAPPHQRRLKTF